MGVCLENNKVYKSAVDKGTYETELAKSGLSELKYKAFLSEFLSTHDRLPELNEIPGADSRKFIYDSFSNIKLEKDKQAFKLLDENSFAIDKDGAMNLLGVNNETELQQKLNSIYKDKIIRIIPLVNSFIIKVKDKPSVYRPGQRVPGKYRATEYKVSNLRKELYPDITNVSASDAPGFLILTEIVDKLATNYGIRIRTITESEVDNDANLKAVVQDYANTKAFVYNGDIYLTEHATIDSPVHEMMHLLLGSVKYTNPEIYSELMAETAKAVGEGSVKNAINERLKSLNLENVDNEQMKNQVTSDILEELLVDEFSKFMTGQSKEFEISKNENISAFEEVFRTMNDILDTVLEGNGSVQGMSSDEKFNSSFRELCEKVGSTVTKNEGIKSFDFELSELSREVENIKTGMLKDGGLEVKCG